MKTKLPGEYFEQEIIEYLFPNLSEEDQRKILNLFDHAINHPWVDSDLKSSIINNICNEHDVQVPENYLEYDPLDGVE